jgi:hypothetical protein
MPKLNHARCHGFLKDEHQGTNSHQLYPVLQGELNCFLTGGQHRGSPVYFSGIDEVVVN